MSLRDRILIKDDIPVQDLDVPEWGEKVLVRGMNGVERARFLQDQSDGDGKINFSKLYPDLVINTLYDPETNEPVFTPEDKEVLMMKSGRAIERIAKISLDLSGLTEDAEKELGNE